MLLLYLCKDQNVVQVHYHNPFGYEGPEDVVHYSLEGGRTVGHSKEHYERFEEATVGTEGHFPFISGLDVYIVETLLDIKFCEVLVSQTSFGHISINSPSILTVSMATESP